MRQSRLFVVSFSLILLFSCQPPTQDKTNETALAATQTSAIVAQTAPACQFSVGFDAWEPYQYIDIGNKVVGLDIEVATAVLNKMQCAITFKAGTWVDLLSELKDGKIDILLGASKTDAREEFALFSDAYRTEEYSLYIRKDDTQSQSFNTVAAFIESGRKIGVVEDYYYGPEVSMLRDGTVTSKQFMPAIIGEVNIARLLDRDIDGFLEDSFVGASFLRRKALGNYIETQGLTINTGNAHIMFSKVTVDKNTVETFNQKLNEVKSSQEYAEIVKRYSY